MKKIIFILFVNILLVNNVQSQIPLDVSINLLPPFPTQYNAWIANSANYVITVSNNSDLEFEYYIRMSVEGDAGGEETFVRLSPRFFPDASLTIAPGQTVMLTSQDLEPLYANTLLDDTERSSNIPVEIDGELPEGTYQICMEVMAYDPTQEIFLSPKLCSEPFDVSHNDLQLVYPPDQSTWTETEIPITFQWIANTSGGKEGNFEYTLKLYELDPVMMGQESVYEYVQSGAVPFYIADPTADLAFIYDENFGLPQLVEGNLYAAQIEVENTSGAWFDNAFLSNINTFWYGYNPYLEDGGDENEIADCFDRCQLSLPQNTTLREDLETVNTFDLGHFTVEGIQLDQPMVGNSISGTGFTTVNFLNNIKIEVRFSGITLNTENQALTGTMTGIVREQDENLVDIVGGALANASLIDQSTLTSLSNVVNNISTISDLSSGGTVDLPFGIGQELSGQTFTLAMIGFEASTEGANMDFLNMMDFSNIGNGFKLGIGATDVCVAPDGFGNEFVLNLVEDIYIPLDGDLGVTFKGGTYLEGGNYTLRENQSPFYFKMVCDGVEAVNISGQISFPEDEFKKEVNDLVIEGEQVKGYFSTLYERDFSQLSITNQVIPKTDFIVDFVMDDFQLSQLPGYGFKLQQGSIDLSDTRNPENMVFPENYQLEEEVSELWQGFYLKNVEVAAPVALTENTERGRATIHHLLIDPELSMDVSTTNLLPRERGSFKKWSFGIDTFELEVLQNTFVEGRIQGGFGAPVLEPQEYLYYNFLLQNKSDSDGNYNTFDGMIRPSENLSIPLAIANASVCESSYFVLQMDKREDQKNVELFIKGDLDINTGSLTTPITGNAYMRLADYQIHYNSAVGFQLKQERDDGLGSYFGIENNQEINCSDLDYAELQDIFDELMESMIDNGEGALRTIAEETDLDVEDDGGTFIDGDEMNGLPIRFRKSKLDVNEGAPELSLVVEAQLAPESLIEAGIVLTSAKVIENNKMNFAISNVDIYFSEGNITLNGPSDGAGLATTENVSVSWTANFDNETFRDALTYTIRIIEVLPDQGQNLDSLFRSADHSFFYEREDINEEEFEIQLNTLTTSFENGKSYAIRVQGIHSEGEAVNNDGFTDIHTFTWGQTAIVGTNEGNNSACASRCSPELPSGSAVNTGGNVTSFTMGNFTIEVENANPSGNLISGTGVAQIDFLNNARLRVSFTDVGLNANGQAIQGVVEGLEADPTLLTQVQSYIGGNVDNQVINTLAEFMDETRMITQVATGGDIDLPFGLNVNMAAADGSGDVNSVNLAFTDFQLTPTTSDIDFLMMLSLPSLGEGLNFGIGAQDICIAPDGFGSEARIYLPQDLDIPIDGSTELVFNGGTTDIQVGQTTIEPFYLEIDCNGFKGVNISGSVSFPQDMIVKEDPLTGIIDPLNPVRGYFGVNLQVQGGDAYSDAPPAARTNFLMTYTMDPFQVKDLEGWGFEVTEATLDLSEVDNSSTMEFPEEYDMADLPQPEFWTGFFLKSLKFKPPSSLVGTDDASERPYVDIQNILIDPEFSAVFSVSNLLRLEDGSVKGWGFSIEEFYLEIVQNNFISAGMEGLVSTPVMEEGSMLTYEAIVEREEGDEGPMLFDAIVRPENDIALPMMVATTTVCQSSYLGLQIAQGEENTHLELFLKGNLALDISANPDADGGFKLGLADFQVKYNTVKGFVMENEVSDGTGTAIGLGISTGDACDGSMEYPDFQALMDDFESQGGDNTNRSITTAAPEETEGGSGSDNSGGDDPIENAMNGFPIRLGDFGIDLVNGNPALSFTVDLAMASGGQGFAAGASLTLVTKKVENDRTFNIGFDRVDFGCARLAVDLDFLEILGCLCRESRTLEGGGQTNGYFGRVMINAMDQIFVDLQGGFATYKRNPDVTEWGTTDYHGFWYIDGTFASNNGIPMGPLRLNAIGGGIYWNMDPPPLPGHDDIDGAVSNEGAAQAVNDCIADLSATYGITMPTGGAPLNASPNYEEYISVQNPGTYGKRTIKLNAGLSLADPKLLVFDPLVQVSWSDPVDGTAGGIDEITVGGYLYLLQEDYFSRGAGAPPPKQDPDGGDPLENDSKSSEGGGGSKMWIAAFNSLYFDRAAADNTLVAFRGTGSFYLNMIPEILYGSAGGPSDRFRVISHDIYIGHRDHYMTSQVTGGDISSLNGQTYWYAYFGNPYNSMGPGSITFDLAGALGSDNAAAPEEAGLTATLYAMMGHGIPSELPPIPEMIQEIIDEASVAANEDNEGTFEGESVDEAEDREELPDKTSGFAFGTTVSVGLSFDKIIYADLQVVLGMDLLFKNISGQQCQSGEENIAEPGVANFYGEGQAYAGLQGALGVRGEILKKEIDVQILELSAAMMIQAGGPNPFWVDGRAGVTYNVLGGLIEGSAYVEVSAGERCRFYDVDPFSLNIINKIFPNGNHTGSNAIDPNATIKTSFIMPVADVNRPWEAELVVPAIGPTGNTNMVRLAPVLDYIRLKKVRPNGTTVTQSGNIQWSNTRKTVRFVPDSPMADSDQQENNKTFRIEVGLRAKEKIGNNWQFMPNYDLDTLVTFEAAPLEPYEELVTHTNPIRGQRYFMPNEWRGTAQQYGNNQLYLQTQSGLIKFYKDLEEERFYSTYSNRDCFYEIVWRDADSMEEVDRHRLTSNQIIHAGNPRKTRLEFPISNQLNPNTGYVLQLVRKQEVNGLPFLSGGLIRMESINQVSNATNADGISAEYSVQFQEDEENLFMDVGAGETLIHMVVFKTSQFSSLQQKMDGAEITLLPAGSILQTGGASYGTAYDRIIIDNPTENFEEIEMIGYTESFHVPGQGEVSSFIQPRIKIVDPAEGNFYNTLKTRMNSLLGNIRAEVDEKYVGLNLKHPLYGTPTTNQFRFDFDPSDYSYVNVNDYNNGNAEIYGHNAMVLDDVFEGTSYFAPPIQQQAMSGSLNLYDIEYSVVIEGDEDDYDPGNTVMIQYDTRDYILEDIESIISWSENAIDMIKNGDPIVAKLWDDDRVNEEIGATINSYNNVVNSNLYSGNADIFSSGTTNSGLTATTTNFYFGGFTSSYIDFYYNLDQVTRNSSSLNKVSAKVRKTLDD